MYRVFMQKLHSNQANIVTDMVDDAANDWNFEGIIAVNEVAASGVSGCLRGVQHICEEGEEAMRDSTFKVIKFVFDSIVASRKNAMMFESHTDVKANFESSRDGDVRSAVSTKLWRGR